MIINKIAVHHTGGFLNNPLASSKHLTYKDIENHHRNRWPNFTSELNGSHVGYTEIIFPDGTSKQTRYLGEETAAVKGYNKSGYYPCLVGNFSPKVDTPTFAQQVTLKNHIIAVLEGEPERAGLKVKKGTKMNVSKLGPHRRWQSTQCYGEGLPDYWAAGLVGDFLIEKINIVSKLIAALVKVINMFGKKKLSGKKVASCLDEDVRG